MSKSTLLFTTLIISLTAHASRHSPQLTKDTVYEFTARLVEATYVGASCASFNYAVTQKFEVLQTNYPNYKYKYVLIIQACPERSGKDFFRANCVYNGYNKNHRGTWIFDTKPLQW